MDAIKEEAFRKQMKNGLSGAYFFFGDEDYLKGFSLKSARELICEDPTFAIFNDIQIDPLDYTPTALVNALMPLPMMGEKKIVSINGLYLSGFRAEDIDALAEAIDTVREYDHNILIISFPAGAIQINKKPNGAFAKLSAVATPVSFEPITGARLTSWVSKHFIHNGAHASERVCNLLIEKCSHSMFSLANETEKLAFYVLQNGRNEVSEEDVEKVACAVVTNEAYALANAILNGRTSDAIAALNQLKFHRVEPVIVLSEVSKTVCDLYTIKKLRDSGMPVGEVAKFLLQPDWRIKRYAAAASQMSDDSFKKAIDLCSEADFLIKRHSYGYTAIERLICCL